MIQKLLKQGWQCVSSNNDFYLWKKFEISQAKELLFYAGYKPVQDEKIFVIYEIYPNRSYVQWCIWNDNEPYKLIYYPDDYDYIVKLALEDRIFTYPQ